MVNPPSPLELPHETQLNVEETDLMADDTIPDMIEVWPQTGRTPIDPYLKSGMYFSPHMHIPRYLFLMNPYASLQAAVVWIFSRIYDEHDIEFLKARIALTPIAFSNLVRHFGPYHANVGQRDIHNRFTPT